MPRLNSRGDWCAGIGGGVVSVNGRAVLPYQSGGSNWVTDDLVIAQVCDGAACTLKTWNRVTGEVVTVAPVGANHLEANGGVWAAWLGSIPATGVYSSTGLHLPLSGLGPVGPDGAIAVKVDYQSAGPWEVVQPDGARWPLTDRDAGNINLLGQGRAVWSEPGGILAARGLIVPIVLIRPFYWLTVREIDGAWWVLYQVPDGRLLLHPADSSRGYVVTTGNTFRPDVRQLPNGTLRIVWATSEGEPARDVQTRDMALTEPRVDLLAPPVETPVKSERVWFQPNLASRDLVTFFDDPANLAGIDVFCLPIQNNLFDGANQGPNTWQALQANHVYKKLKQAGVPFAVEMGLIKEGDCQIVNALKNLTWVVEHVREQGGDVACVSWDEPLTGNAGCHLTIDQIADAAAEFTKAAHALNVRVGLLEAWPNISLDAQQTFLIKLKDRGVLPAYWHADIDEHRAVKEKKSISNFVINAQRIATELGITFGVFIVGYDHATDAEYFAESAGFARDYWAMLPNVAHVHVASWAFRLPKPPGIQDVPNNLGPNGLLASYRQTKALFAGELPPPPPPPPPPPEGHPMLSTFTDPQKETIAISAIKPVVGTNLVTWILPNGRVYSCQPDGSYGERDPGTEGGYEKCRMQGNVGTFKPDDGKYFTKAYVLVDGL